MLRQLVHAVVAYLLGTSLYPPESEPDIAFESSPRVNTTMASRFPYDTTKVRGVNLGGWLVLEPWITPSLFPTTNLVDEWTYGQYATSAMRTALKNHWDTWITEDDLRQIAAAGLNHVRIPIGFWAFDTAGTPYITGQYPYLLKAIQWAQKYKIHVLIDLHGVPGSQNGFDNSGRLGDVNWYKDQSNIDRTNAIIKTLAQEFSQSKYAGVVSSIGPMNEPAGFKAAAMLTATKKYWQTSYDTIRSYSSDVAEVIHDAFQDLSTWNNFMPSSKYSYVIMDTHHYQIFSDAQVAMTWPQHYAAACSRGNAIANWSKGANNLWTIVGEFTPTPYDCALYLNGRNKGSRYDGTFPNSPVHGSCYPFTGPTSRFSASYKTFMRKFFEAQISTFEKANGWIMWTWKTEITDEWSYQAGLAGGWIPRNPSERQYPNVCG